MKGCMGMERLKSLVLELSNAERFGGRAVVVDPHTLVLNDCMNWSCRCTDVVAAHFPDVHISVRACRQSLSGFSVVFHRDPGLGTRVLSWYLAIGLVLACVCYVLLRPPWWDKTMSRI